MARSEAVMTDDPLTVEERAELLALCEALGSAEVATGAIRHDVVARAFAALPRALRDLERAEAEIERKTAELMALREQYNAACDEIGRLRREMDNAAAWIAVHGGPNAMQDVLQGTRWLLEEREAARAEIARLRRALDAAGIVLGSET